MQQELEHSQKENRKKDDTLAKICSQQQQQMTVKTQLLAQINSMQCQIAKLESTISDFDIELKVKSRIGIDNYKLIP